MERRTSMNKMNCNNGGHSSIQQDEKHPFIGHDKKSVNKKENRTQDLLFAATLGLTSGLIFGEFLNTPSSLVGRLTATMFPIGWTIYPFKPYRGTYNTLLKEPERIDRTAFLLFFCFIGVCIDIQFQHVVTRLNERPNSSNSLKALVLVVQSTWMAANIFAAYRLRELDPPQEKLQTGYSIGCSILNKFKGAGSVISDFSLKKYESGVSYLATVPKYWGGDDQLSNPVTSKSSREAFRLQLRASTASTKSANQKSRLIFERLISFIQNDTELKEAYKSAMHVSADKLLPSYKVDPSIPVDDLDAEAWGNEQDAQNYWYGQTSRVRDFLLKNPEFAKLFQEKFLASDILDKDELLNYFAFSMK